MKELTVKELRQMGYTVEINHFRYIGNPKKSYNLISYQHIRTEKLQNQIRAKGGLTTLQITDNEGNIVCSTEARCSKEDPFNRKRAVQICLGRAKNLMVIIDAV